MFNLLEHLLTPMFDKDDGGSGGGGGGGGTATDDDTRTRQQQADQSDANGGGKDDKDDKGGGKDDTGSSTKDDSFPWDEHNRLKREAAERARKDREAEEKRKQDEGKHEEVISGLRTENTELKDRLDRIEKSGRVEKVAKRLGFYDPDDAARYLTTEQMEDERSIEQALKDLKKEKPRLFDDTGRSGGDVDNDDRDNDDPGRRTRTGEQRDGDGKTFGIETLRSVKRKDT